MRAGWDIWFTERDEGRVGRITPGGLVTEWALSNPDGAPHAITFGPNGNLWFTQSTRTRSVG